VSRVDRGESRGQLLALMSVDLLDPSLGSPEREILQNPAAPSDSKGTRVRLELWAHIGLIALAMGSIFWSLPSLGPRDLGVLGLASSLPLPLYVGLAVLLVGFSLAVIRRDSPSVLGVYLVAVTIVIHGLGPLVYDNLRYPWAWKHVGIVDFILRTGGVDPGIEALRAYHNWPGFFGLAAFLTEMSGVTTLELARWAQVFFNLLYLGVLSLIFTTFTTNNRLVATALMIFTLGNWVGQDYFAPQAIAFLFYLMVLALLLRWFERGARSAQQLGSGGEPLVAAAVLLVLLMALVVTHQLTPIMTVLALGGLVIFRRTRVVWPLLVTAAFMVVWMVGFARPFLDEYLPRVIADFGDVGGRVESGLVDYGQVDTSQRIVSLGARGLSGTLLGLAVVGYWRGFRAAISWPSAVVLFIAPVLVVGASSYGDEILFRALLFVLPMAALFCAALWFVRERSDSAVFRLVTLSALLIGLAWLSLLAQHGNDNYTVFSDEEVEAATLMYETASPGSAVIQLSNSYPTKFINYENLTELSVASFSRAAKDRYLADPAGVFAEWLSDPAYEEGYVLITRSQEADVARRGFLPAASPLAIRITLLSSESFEVLYESDDALLLRLIEAPA
jgi:hypothetical protein